jgi:hypothetical protein
MHSDTVGGLARILTMVAAAVAIAILSFQDSFATTLGVVTAGVAIGLIAVTLIGAAFSAFRSSHRGSATTADSFAVVPEQSDAPHL